MNLLLLFLLQAVENLTWGDLDVVWIERNSPVTYMAVRFADGSMHAANGVLKGASSGLDWGTTKFSRKDLVDFWEFYSAIMNTSVGQYEFSVSLSGPTKDFTKIASRMCHVLTNSTYPEDQMVRNKELTETTIKNKLNNSNSVLYTTMDVFSEITRHGTPYSYPVNGKLKDVRNYTSELLRNELEYMVKTPKKTVYLLGPKSSLKIRDILIKNCGFSGDFVREIPLEQTQVSNSGVYFLEVSGLSQSTVFVGSQISKNEQLSPFETGVASSFLSSAEGSVIRREIRDKLGLTYLAFGGVSNGEYYGMSYLGGQTKKETTVDLIKAFMQMISNLSLSEENLQVFDRSKKDLTYAIYSGQETDSKYLNFLSSVMRNYKLTIDDVPRMGEMFNQVSESKIIDYLKNIFIPSKVSIVVLGDASVLEQLQTSFTDVKVLDINDYL